MPSALNIVNRFFPEVTTVKDAKQDSAIEVTQEDCTSSDPQDHGSCAMAVACKRQLGVDGAIVSLHIAYVIKGNTALRYGVPESVSREVISFDRNGGFMPGSYRLQAPAKGHRLGEHYKEIKKKRHRRNRKTIHHITSGVRKSLRDVRVQP
jgi:hypothetical protein